METLSLVELAYLKLKQEQDLELKILRETLSNRVRVIFGENVEFVIFEKNLAYYPKYAAAISREGRTSAGIVVTAQIDQLSFIYASWRDRTAFSLPNRGLWLFTWSKYPNEYFSSPIQSVSDLGHALQQIELKRHNGRDEGSEIMKLSFWKRIKNLFTLGENY